MDNYMNNDTYYINDLYKKLYEEINLDKNDILHIHSNLYSSEIKYLNRFIINNPIYKCLEVGGFIGIYTLNLARSLIINKTLKKKRVQLDVIDQFQKSI
jgi:hypothetical protein